MPPIRALGLDFGTTNSSAGFYDGSTVQLLPIDLASPTPHIVKTILYITRDDTAWIGEQAVQTYYQQNIGRGRRFIKKWIGEIEYRGSDMFYVTDVYCYIDELLPGRLLQYLKTALRIPGYTGTTIFTKRYTAQDLVTRYLTLFKQRIDTLTGHPTTQLVLGRPVHLTTDPTTDAQAQQRLKAAAQQAGFTDIHFELEPIAAALDYESRTTRPENIVVFDFGGGTLDITVMRIGNQTNRQVLATGGIDIAGSNFDAAIIRAKLLNHFGNDTRYGSDRRIFPPDIVEHITDWQTLPALGTLEMRELFRQAMQSADHPERIENLYTLIFNEYGFMFYNKVEQAKIALSTDFCTTIDLHKDGLSLWQMLTRQQFEQIIAADQQRVQTILLDTIHQSSLPLPNIDRVIATGGSSSIPCFQTMLARLFGPEKITAANAFTSVTAGLAIKAHELFNT